MNVRRIMALVLLMLATCSCGLVGEEDNSDLTVTVVKGVEVAPADMRQAAGPVARYLAGSEVIVFVSEPLYSGSCPPDAGTEANGDGNVTLTLDDTHEGSCTADANRYTFLIQGFIEMPTGLVVLEDGQEDIELDLSE